VHQYAPLSFTQVDHPLWKEETMSSTDDCNNAANNSVFELYEILKSISTEMTTSTLLKNYFSESRSNFQAQLTSVIVAVCPASSRYDLKLVDSTK
jgi:hypothetical protein